MAEEKSFISYVAETKTEYKYVLKFALNEMTDAMIDILEASLARYDLKSASAFRNDTRTGGMDRSNHSTRK